MLDVAEDDRILSRIFASPRPASRRRPVTLPLAGVAVIGAVAAAISLEFPNAHPSSAGHGPQRPALTGAHIQLAGYHFRTPAGFRASSNSCVAISSSSAVTDLFVTAASAEGGCIEVSLSTSYSEGAERVPVGDYDGYYAPEDSSGESTLFVELAPAADVPQYLALFAKGLTKSQLVAVAQSGLAQSGLPARPGPTTTTG